MDFIKYMNKKYNMEKVPKKKRSRSDNWVPADKTMLKELIDEKIEIVECKNTDTNTNNIKKQAWLEIEESFNMKCQGPKRTVPQLKTQWGNIKTAKNKEAKAGSPPPSTSLKCSSTVPPMKLSPPSVRSSISSAPSSPSTAPSLPSTSSTLPSPEPSSPIQQIGGHSPRSSSQTRPPKRKLDIKKMREHYLEKIAAVEIRCRTELHKLQCQNELLKNKMLLKKLEVQEQKLKYYKLECLAADNKK